MASYTDEDKKRLSALGLQVRAARISKGWTQEQLAEESGLNVTYVSDLERGKRNVAYLNLCKLSRVLGVSFGL